MTVGCSCVFVSPQQAEWDKDLKDVPMFRLLAMNGKEWWLIVLGLLGAVVNGSVFPIFAILFGSVLNVSISTINHVGTACDCAVW